MISGSALLLTISQSISREAVVGFVTTVRQKWQAASKLGLPKGQGYKPLDSAQNIEVL